MQNLRLARVYRTTEELAEAEIAEVQGTIPFWLNGSFVRSGPGVFDLADNFQMNHIFDGYAILSKFDISGSQNEIRFDKKLVQSEAYSKATAAGRPVVCEYGTRGYPDPNQRFFSRLIPHIVPPLTDNCNLAVFQLGPKIFASSETNRFREIRPNTLTTLEIFDSAKLFGLNSFSCHPLIDDTGAVFNIGPSRVTGLKYNVVRIPPLAPDEPTGDSLKRSKIIASIPSSWHGLMSFNHSFAMTANYIVIIEQPYVYVVSRVLSGAITKSSSISDWLQWRSDLTNNFLVIEKSTGKLVKTQFCSVTPFFFLHVINAYEDTGHIVIDLFTSPNPSVLNSMTVEALRHGIFREDDLPQGQRFVLPIFNIRNATSGVNLLTTFKTSAKAVKLNHKIHLTPQVLTLPGLDMPTLNRNRLGKSYSHFYATGSVTNGIWRNSINKIDTKTDKVVTWRRSKAFYVGEALFVANPERNSEDDGVLISAVVTDGSDSDSAGKDFLLILDAATMEEVARGYVKGHVPQGVHGTFIRDTT